MPDAKLIAATNRIKTLEDALKQAAGALQEISHKSWRPMHMDNFCHPEGCDSPGIAREALDRIIPALSEEGK